MEEGSKEKRLIFQFIKIQSLAFCVPLLMTGAVEIPHRELLLRATDVELSLQRRLVKVTN